MLGLYRYAEASSHFLVDLLELFYKINESYVHTSLLVCPVKNEMKDLKITTSTLTDPVVVLNFIPYLYLYCLSCQLSMLSVVTQWIRVNFTLCYS